MAKINESISEQLPWIDVLAEDGMMVVMDPNSKGHRSLVAVARLTEPYTQLWTPAQTWNQSISRIDAHFRSVGSIGYGEQMQVIRYISQGLQEVREELDNLEAAIHPQGEMAKESSRIYLDWARRFQAQGYIPKIDTWLYLTHSLHSVIVSEEVLSEAKASLKRRMSGLGNTFIAAGYDFRTLHTDQEILEPLWKYCNPRQSASVSAPMSAKKELRQGNINLTNLLRNPHLAVASIRRQLGASSYSFHPHFCYGDQTYQALLNLDILPDDARMGLLPLYQEMANLRTQGIGIWISQSWLMTGKAAIGKVLEGRERLARDLYNSFGEKVANSQLPDTIENIQTMRYESTEANQIVQYTCTARVDAPDIDTLSNACLELQGSVNQMPGARLYREEWSSRIRKTWLQGAPGVPVSMVDYKYRGNILRADRASFLLPRYGEPQSDPVGHDMPYSLYWTASGSPVRIVPWGVSNSSIWVVYGGPRTGKGVWSKSTAQQYSAFDNSFFWYIDNNAEGTSVDFLVKANDGINIRFDDSSEVCLPTFDIAGETPTATEKVMLAESLWFDIHRGQKVLLSGDLEAILDQSIIKVYNSYENPSYDQYVETLYLWENDDYTKVRHEWAKSLELFCSGKYLSGLYKKKMDDGKYYRLFGDRNGISLRGLLDYRIVSWNLQGMSNEFLRRKVALLLKKSFMSFGIMLSNKGAEENRNYYFNCDIDEGWSLFHLENGDALLNEIVRKHGHIGMCLKFITQGLKELKSAMGAVVLDFATHFIVTGAGDSPKEESETLGLNPLEQRAILHLDQEKGFFGSFYFRRRKADGSYTSYLLVNPVPAITEPNEHGEEEDSGSWIALLMGGKEEGEMRKRILKLLDADSIAEAQAEQIREAGRIFGLVWPHGLPMTEQDKNKRSRGKGWLMVEELARDYHEQKDAVTRMERI